MTLGEPGAGPARRWSAVPLALLLLAAGCTSEPASPEARVESPSPFAGCAAVLAPPSASSSLAPGAATPSDGSGSPAGTAAPRPGASGPAAGASASAPGDKEPGQGPFKTPPPIGEDAEIAPTSPAPVSTPARAGSAPTSARSALPDISLPCFTGGAPVRLAEVKGPAVINLWASWCEPCRAELPVIQSLADRSQGRVHVIGVDTGDSREAAASFATGRDVSIPTLYDRDKQLLAALGRITLPITVFVDPAGRQYVHSTPVDARSLSELLREHTGVAVAP